MRYNNIYNKGGPDMDKEELKKLLKENLVIELYETRQEGTKYINIEVRFDGEVICESQA